MFYLASFCSHPEVVVREQRFRAACHATARLIPAGHIVFSRIIHGHPLVLYGLPTDLSCRKQLDRDHLLKCDEVVVSMLHC